MGTDIYQMVDAPIKPDALHHLVLSAHDGAITTFAGVVRNNTKGRATQHLVYDAYKEMAEKKMREIDCVGMLHGTGKMEVGDISVLIAVSSPHRAASLEACHYAIDQLKASVPIWKKEVWEDGEAWIEGDPSSPQPASMGDEP